jgi:sugar phosphate isomerase/epimerase
MAWPMITARVHLGTMKICLNRATAGGGLPLEQFVALAADAGFEGADVDLAYGAEKGAAALKEVYDARGMAFGGWGPPVDWRSDESKMKEGLPTLDRQAKVAAALGIDSCATWIMPSSDQPFSANFRFHAERLKEVARVLGAHGLRLGLEFVAPWHLRRKFKHEFIFTPGLMLELAAEAGPNVGLLVDCFHCYVSGTPWEEVAKIPKEKIVLAHFNDAPRKEIWRIEDGDRHVPGEGGIDVPGFFKALTATGYQGPVSLEIFSDELRKLKPEEAARRAAAGVKKVLGLGS